MLIVPITDVWNDNYPLLKAKWLKYRAARRSRCDIPLAAYVPHSSHGSESRASLSGYFPIDS